MMCPPFPSPARRRLQPRSGAWVRLALGLGCAITALALPPSQAADWPQYHGPQADGRTTEKILTTWPAGGPRQVWKTPLNSGFSSFAVASSRVYTLIARQLEGANREVCVALDAQTGRELWVVPVGMAKFDGGGDAGASHNKVGMARVPRRLPMRRGFMC